MAKDIPDWLDKDFLATVLQGGEDKVPKVSVISFHGKLATAPGENFSSDIFRIHVQYKVEDLPKEQSISLIFKVPDPERFVPVLGGQSVFDKEFRFYTKLLPKMNEKLKCRIAPKTFYTPIKNLLIMEDLKLTHSQIPIRKQFDFAHGKAAFIFIAKFHAASVAVNYEHPELIEINNEPFFREGGPLERWVKTGCKTFGEILSQIDGCKKYADFFNSRVDNVWETGIEVVKKRPGHFNVLNHGDAWINNMLFEYNESKEIVDVKMIDFQVSKYASPVFDLLYTMYTSVKSEVREHRQQELLDIYLETLNSTLEQLGCVERLSAAEFKEHLMYARPWFIHVLAFQITTVLVGDVEPIDLFTDEDIITGRGDGIMMKCFESKVLKPHLIDIMRQYFYIIAP